MKLYRLAVLCGLSLCIQACGPEEPQNPEPDPGPQPTAKVEKTFTATLPGGAAWSEGATISVFDDRFNEKFVLQDGSQGSFSGKIYEYASYKAVCPYDNSLRIDSEGFVRLRVGTRQRVGAATPPVQILAASAAGNLFAFANVLTTVSFTLSSSKVASVTFRSLSSEGVGGTFRLSLGDETFALADSLSVEVLPSSEDTFPAGTYSFSLAPVTLSSGYEVIVRGKGGDSATVRCENTFKAVAGGSVDLGTVDTELAGRVDRMVLPIHFKQEDKLLDSSSETGTGSAWPFSESKGSSGTHARCRVLHTLEGGYPVIWSGEEFYLNSKGGLQFYGSGVSDYFEFPAFAQGRIISVSAAFGGLPSPSITDVFGNVIPGGEPKSSLQSAVLYEWNLEGTDFGQPVRMVTGKASGQILQFNITYEMRDLAIVNDIQSVDVSDSGNGNFGTGKVDLNANLTLKSGASESGVTCGFESQDYLNREQFAATPSTLSAFNLHLDNVSSSGVVVRAWACSERGWRVYSDEITTSSDHLKIDFWLNGAVNNPFTPGLKFGASKASELSGTEQVYTLNGTSFQVCSFAPKDGTSYYIDLNNSSACRIYSAGTEMLPMTYFKFPAINGKVLREVVITRAVGSGSTFFLCTDPSTRNAAENSRCGEVVTIASGATGSISCPFASPGTAYYLVFPEKAGYCLRSIRLVYEDSAGASGPSVQDDPTLNPDDPSADPSGVFDYSSLTSMGHPRVLIDKAGFDQIRSVVTGNRASNRFLCDITDRIVSLADGYVNSPVAITYTLDASGKRLLTQSRNAFQQLAVMAYAYQVTGQAKYVVRCRKILFDVCAFSDWHPSHFLDVAEMSLGVSLAYDWLYDVLTTEEKVTIRNRLVNYAMIPSKTAGFHTSEGNWNQVCNAGVVAAAIAVYEKDKQNSYAVIEKAVQSNSAMMTKIYSPDGNYAEGYGYWGYGTGFQALMMKMFETAFGHCAGLKEVDGFLKTAGYMLFMVGPGGPFSYADGGSSSESASVGMWWFAGEMKDKALLANELRLFNKGNYASGSDCRMLPLVPAVVKDFNIGDTSSAYPTDEVWSGNGKIPVVMVHTGWQFNESDKYLGIKAGKASGPHGHMDAGSFVYDALGKRWSSDVTRGSYATLEVALGAVGGDFWKMTQKSLRWDILAMNCYGHSTLCIDYNDGSISKTYPTDHNVSGNCTVSSVINSSSEKGAVLDMGNTFSGQVSSVTRTVKIVGGKDLVVIDRITALPSHAAPVIWHMVTPATASSAAAGITLTSGDKKMYLSVSSFSSSVAPTYTVTDYVRPSSWTPRTWDSTTSSYRIVGYECTIPAGATVTLTTTLSPDSF